MLATSQYNLQRVNLFLFVFKIYNLKNRKPIFPTGFFQRIRKRLIILKSLISYF